MRDNLLSDPSSVLTYKLSYLIQAAYQPYLTSSIIVVSA